MPQKCHRNELPSGLDQEHRRSSKTSRSDWCSRKWWLQSNKTFRSRAVKSRNIRNRRSSHTHTHTHTHTRSIRTGMAENEPEKIINKTVCVRAHFKITTACRTVHLMKRITKHTRGSHYACSLGGPYDCKCVCNVFARISAARTHCLLTPNKLRTAPNHLRLTFFRTVSMFFGSSLATLDQFVRSLSSTSAVESHIGNGRRLGDSTAFDICFVLRLIRGLRGERDSKYWCDSPISQSPHLDIWQREVTFQMPPDLENFRKNLSEKSQFWTFRNVCRESDLVCRKKLDHFKRRLTSDEVGISSRIFALGKRSSMRV